MRLQRPARRLALQDLVGGVRERGHHPRPGVAHLIGLPDPEEPRRLAADGQLTADADDSLAEVDGLADGLLHQGSGREENHTPNNQQGQETLHDDADDTQHDRVITSRALFPLHAKGAYCQKRCSGPWQVPREIAAARQGPNFFERQCIRA